MQMRRVSLALCAALAAGIIGVPEAGAVTSETATGVRVDRSGENAAGPYINAEIQRDASGRFSFVHPGSAAGIYRFSLRSMVSVDGAQVVPGWQTAPGTTREGSADVVTFAQSQGAVEVTRAYRVLGSTVETVVTVANNADTSAEVAIDLGVNARSDASYLVKTAYQGGENGRFTGTLPPGETHTVRAVIGLEAREEALDSDRDGLRDVWERQGMLLSDGTRLPIHEWGTDEQTPDLFLQLNWMKSEWETLKCDRQDRFEPTVEGFTKFAECARANTNDYAPDPAMLKQTEDLFASKGINLHIDAGPRYMSESLSGMPKRMRQGGPKLDYQRYFFADSTDPTVRERLSTQRDALLGSRKSVFRVGIIGDQRAPGDTSTGVALTGDSVFYVANFGALSSPELVRNTILHEFGHTLGLKHWGAQTDDNTAPKNDWLRDYKSVMSYAHQLSLHNYAEQPTKSSYYIPADWDNLQFAGRHIGRGASDYVGGNASLPTTPADVYHEEDAEELIRASADDNNGKASFRMIPTGNGQNGVVTLSPENALRGEVRNLGTTTERFTVEAHYPSGQSREEVTLRGARSAQATQAVDMKISPAALIDNPVLPVDIYVKDSAGKTVFRNSYKVSALQYTDEEAKRVLGEILDSNADESVKQLARQVLQGRDQAGSPQAKKSGSSDLSDTSIAAIVIGSLLGLLGLGALGYGWAVNQGLLKLPF